MGEEIAALVIHNGSGMCKAGCSRNDAPRVSWSAWDRIDTWVISTEQEHCPEPEGPPLNWTDVEKGPASYPPHSFMLPQGYSVPFTKALPDSKAGTESTQIRMEAFSTSCVCCCPGVAGPVCLCSHHQGDCGPRSGATLRAH